MPDDGCTTKSGKQLILYCISFPETIPPGAPLYRHPCVTYRKYVKLPPSIDDIPRYYQPFAENANECSRVIETFCIEKVIVDMTKMEESVMDYFLAEGIKPIKPPRTFETLLKGSMSSLKLPKE